MRNKIRIIIFLAAFLIFFVNFTIIIAASSTSTVSLTSSPTSTISPTFTMSPIEIQRHNLEAQLKQYEQQINDYEKTVTILSKQGKSLKSEVNILNVKIAKLKVQIKAITLNIGKLNDQIEQTQLGINDKQTEIDVNKKILSKIFQSLYENENKNPVEIFLANVQLSDFVNNLNNLVSVQDKMKQAIGNIEGLKQNLIDDKQRLILERSDAQDLKDYVSAEESAIQKTQSTKNNLLKITKGKESEYQKILKETKKSAAEIRAQIFRLYGGGQMSFGDAYKMAKMAEEATGVRAAFLLAILNRESALGKNVGQCNYNQVMSRSEQNIFFSILDELGLRNSAEAGSLKVSCANNDGPYGGAMGPAQFMPSTWKKYQSQIAELSGDNPPNPWKNSDAFIAAALYLKNAGALNNEKTAAARYYCGSNWARYVCTGIYGSRVVAQAQKFQNDIDALKG